MRPSKRLTAREAAGDIYYLINTFGCRIRIRVNSIKNQTKILISIL